MHRDPVCPTGVLLLDLVGLNNYLNICLKLVGQNNYLNIAYMVKIK